MLHPQRSLFIIQAKSNLRARRTVSRPVDKTVDLISDHTVRLTGPKSKTIYPESFRRVRYYDREHNRRLAFLTNNVHIFRPNVSLQPTFQEGRENESAFAVYGMTSTWLDIKF
jgi:hypothetical protein